MTFDLKKYREELDHYMNEEMDAETAILTITNLAYHYGEIKIVYEQSQGCRCGSCYGTSVYDDEGNLIAHDEDAANLLRELDKHEEGLRK